MKKWLGRFAKLGFFIAAFLGVVATVLFNMGGSNDTLKSAIEDYISASTGYSARIESFNNMTFFPSISVDIGGIILKKPDVKALQAWMKAESEKPEAEQGQIPPPEIGYDKPDGYVEKVMISIGFFDAGFGRGRKIKNLQIQNARFNAGTVHHKPVSIETLGIDETPQGLPFIGVDGEIGGTPFDGKLDIESIGSRSNPKYKLGEEGAFAFEIGDLTLTGIMRPRTLGGVHIRDLKVIDNGQNVLNATFTFIRASDGNITTNGEFNLPEFGSTGVFDWEIIAEQNMQINGTIDASTLDQNDFISRANLSKAWQKWNAIFAKPNDENSTEHNVTVTAETLIKQSNPIKNFEGRANIGDKEITFSASQKETE